MGAPRLHASSCSGASTFLPWTVCIRPRPLIKYRYSVLKRRTRLVGTLAARQAGQVVRSHFAEAMTITRAPAAAT